MAFRTPPFPWIVTAIATSLLVVTGLWFGGQMIVRGLFPGALSPGTDHLINDLVRQWVLGLSWIIPSLCLWAIFPPASRLRAFATAFGLALLVAVIGSVAAFVTLKHTYHFDKNQEFDTTFSRLSFLMILGQIAMGAPAAFVLSLIGLKPRSAQPA